MVTDCTTAPDWPGRYQFPAAWLDAADVRVGERDAMRRIRDRFGAYDGRFDDDC
jgi:hypothetical protein